MVTGVLRQGRTREVDPFEVRSKKYERLAESYAKTYPEQMQDFMKGKVARMKSINHFDVVGLGKMLEAFEMYLIEESTNGSTANLGPLPKIGLDVITTWYADSPIAVVCGIQPIDEPVGLVWFKSVLAQTTQGNVTLGQSLMSPLAMPQAFPLNYASDTLLTNTVLSVTGAAASSYTNQDLRSDTIASPINPNICVINVAAKFNSGADVPVFPPMIVDPTTGNFSSAAVANTNLYTVYGNVDFATGQLDIQFGPSAPSSNLLVTASFALLLEEATDIPKNLMNMTATTVQADFFALKSSFGFAENYMMNRRWGMSAEDEMTRDLTSMLNAEVFNLVLYNILQNIPATNSSITWGREPGSGTSYYEHIMTLPAAVNDAEVLMQENLGRGEINTFICGNKAYGILKYHPDFKSSGFNPNALGPQLAGTFDGKPVVRIPAQAQLDGNTMIGLWKGPTPFEAPVAYCPYMPLTLTELQGTGTNPLQRQKAAAIWGAVAPMITNGIVEIVFDQSNFDYGAYGT